MLSINFSQIKNSNEVLTKIDQEVQMRPEFFDRSKNLVDQVKKVQLTGSLFYNEPYVTGDFHVKASLVVPSSRSLEPVDYQQDFRFTENYTDEEVPKEKIDESEIPIVKVEDDLIDLQTAVEDNIILNIPITILTPEEEKEDIYPQGNGWSVISKSDYDQGKKNQVNPALAKLKSLLEQDEHDKNNKQK
ncbi:uncharacterized protein GA0061073_0078 [Lactobacillus apis]|uniref:DUF177 domain-containing protein n=1 Tax=Lactobacillus apis TaxID=303541 RepID=UPI0008162AEC|nr:DUF177 domain-containing protein [Lactobacillus apis]GGG30690.1 DNA-binding protein [Lactobacillus apis]SCB72474.1 uncharacterized protein GA0061073_0078 [Lactobacillus apis]